MYMSVLEVDCQLYFHRNNKYFVTFHSSTVLLFVQQLRIMDALQESSPAPSGPQVSPVPGHNIDLTEDLSQQLEDIISTYQADEIPAEPEDAKVTSVKVADTRKEQKLEKKMLKNLGSLGFHCVLMDV